MYHSLQSSCRVNTYSVCVDRHHVRGYELAWIADYLVAFAICLLCRLVVVVESRGPPSIGRTFGTAARCECLSQPH